MRWSVRLYEGFSNTLRNRIGRKKGGVSPCGGTPLCVHPGYGRNSISVMENWRAKSLCVHPGYGRNLGNLQKLFQFPVKIQFMIQDHNRQEKMYLSGGGKLIQSNQVIDFIQTIV